MLVVETQTRGERKASPQIIRRLVVESQRADRQRVGGNETGIFRYILRLNRVVYVLNHTECAKYPLIPTVVVGLERKLLTYHILVNFVDNEI